MIGSWLGGPSSLAEAQGVDLGYPGRRLGLPESGPGSVAGQGRRLVATFIDWMLAYLIAAGISDAEPGQSSKLSLYTLGIFAAMQVLLVGTVGTGIGGRILRMRVVRLDGRVPGPLWALARTGLTLMVFPPVVWDRDTRGLHDQITGTVVVMMGTPAAAKKPGARKSGTAKPAAQATPAKKAAAKKPAGRKPSRTKPTGKRPS